MESDNKEVQKNQEPNVQDNSKEVIQATSETEKGKAEEHKASDDTKQELMNAIVINEWGAQPTFARVPKPKPKHGQVLIKVEAAPINPSDLAFTKGGYGKSGTMPMTIGFEGSGVVVESGGGLLGWNLKGNRVAFAGGPTSSGSWAEYIVVDVETCMTLDKNTSFETGASVFVNPLTVVAFEDIVESNNHKAVIHTAAASQVGRMLVRVLAKKKIPLINIVRKEEQREILKKLGAEIILNSSDPDFEKDLKYLAENYKATVCFDAIGGEITWQITKNMPKHSTTYVYGLLSQSRNGNYDPVEMLSKDRTIKGFMMPDWLKTKSLVSKARIMWRVKSEINSDLKSDISGQFPLDQVTEALDFYKNNATKGKNIFRPQQKGTSTQNESEEKK